MRKREKRFLSFLMLAIVITVIPLAAQEAAAFLIPELEEIHIDGAEGDWGDSGFLVDFLADPKGHVRSADDFDVTFRLGWNRQGLLVLALVHDDHAYENDNESRLWQRDCLEIFISDMVGSSRRYQVVIAPGADRRFKVARSRIYDWRPDDPKNRELVLRRSTRVLDSGYLVEVLLPWSNLDLEPKSGLELGFQLSAYDHDGEEEDANGPLRVGWYPGVDPQDSYGMVRLKLAAEPSPRVRFRIDREIGLDRSVISVQGRKEFVGESVEIRRNNETVFQSEMQPRAGRSEIRFEQLDVGNDIWPRSELIIGGKTAAVFEELPTLARILKKYVQAVGGRDSLEKLTARQAIGRFLLAPSENRTSGQSAPIAAYAMVPNKWYMALHMPGGLEQQGFDGKTGWTQNLDRIEKNASMERSRLAFLLNPQGPLRLQYYFPGMVLRGKDMVNGRPVYVVDPTGVDRSQSRLHFDAESGLLVKIGYNWELQGYWKIDDVLFPLRSVIQLNQGKTIFIFRDIKHNMAIDDAQFAPPEAAEVFSDAFEGIDDLKVLPMLQMKDLAYAHGEMNIPCRDGRFLYDRIIEGGYKRGLEIGTFNGYSTLWLGLAFRKTGGRVITLEIDAGSGREAETHFKNAGLDKIIDARIADALKEIPKIEGRFDFVFIDAWKPDYLKYLELVRDRVSPGGLIIAHNVTNYARDMVDFLETVKNDPGLETTFNEISVEGMAVIVVRKPAVN